MVDEVGVQWVVAGDENGEGTLPRPSRAACLLPQRCPGARIAGDDDGVQPRDIDAEFEGGGGGEAEEFAGVQGAFEGAAFLGQVAAAVGGDAAGEGAIDLGEAFLGDHRDQLGAAPGTHESHGVDALHGQVGQQVRRLGGGGAADGGALLAVEIGERRLPESEDELSAGRGVVGDLEDRETRQTLRSDGRVGGGGGRQQEHRFRAVAGAQAA